MLRGEWLNVARKRLDRGTAVPFGVLPFGEWAGTGTSAMEDAGNWGGRTGSSEVRSGMEASGMGCRGIGVWMASEADDAWMSSGLRWSGGWLTLMRSGWDLDAGRAMSSRRGTGPPIRFADGEASWCGVMADCVYGAEARVTPYGNGRSDGGAPGSGGDESGGGARSGGLRRADSEGSLLMAATRECSRR